MTRYTMRVLALPVAVAVLIAVSACGSHDGMPGMDHDAGSTSGTTHSGMPGMEAGAMPAGDGLTPSVAGLTLRLADKTLTAGQPGSLRLQVLDSNGKPVTAFVPDQTKLMHLYLIRSDLTGFQHLHPQMGGDGTWTAATEAVQPGSWRVYTSFTANDGGKHTAVVLGDQLSVPGTATTTPLPAAASSAAVDGYTVAIDGAVTANMAHTLSVTITKDGKPVTDLQPYLDTYAHLTAFHDGDLAFAHLHPHGTAAGDHGGPTLTFEAVLTRPGNWRLFLQFQTGGTLHTAAVTLTVG